MSQVIGVHGCMILNVPIWIVCMPFVAKFQMGESVEVRLVAEPCEESPGATASLVASLDNASIQSTPGLVTNSIFSVSFL